MDNVNLPLLTVGVTLIACVLGVMGLYAYSGGKADRDALVERLSYVGPRSLRHLSRKCVKTSKE
ncbi:hypothetical protein ABZ086_33540 [Streptomyces halstedii]